MSEFNKGDEVVIIGTDAEFEKIFLPPHQWRGKTVKLKSSQNNTSFAKDLGADLIWEVENLGPGTRAAWFPETMLQKVGSMSLEGYKKLVRETTIKYAIENELCDDVDRFLKDINLAPVKAITIRLDSQNSYALKEFFYYLNNNDIPFEIYDE